ncbi:MAG: ATP-binding protein [Verrucomicrobiota bacterium JB022]|nr:ATP-binding protein [Verrucomicrobiota bacterium JB022]
MMKLPGKSIRMKVTLALLMTSVLSLVVSFTILLIFEWRSAERELVDKLHTEARIVRDNLSAAVAFRSAPDARRMMNGLKSDREVNAAAVYLDTGELIANFVQPGSSFEIPPAAPPIGVKTGADAIEIVLPIEVGGSEVGRLLLVAGYDARDERFVLYLITAACAFLLAAASSLLAARMLERRLSTPVLALADLARRVTRDRDYSVYVPDEGSDEMAQLAQALALMLREVNQREEELKQAVDRLHLALEASRTFIWEWDHERDALYWQSVEGLPIALESLQGISVVDLLERVHPNERARLVNAFHTAATTQDEFSVEFSVLEGEQRVYVSCRGKGFRDAEGNLTRAIGVAHDISQRRQAERALHWREQEFRALVEHSPDVIARYNRELRIIYINSAVLDLTGLTSDYFTGKTLNELQVAPERLEAWRIAIERIYEGAQHAELEFDYPHQDGTLRTFHTRLAPELAPTGEVAQVLAVSREITERKRTEQELRRAKDRAEEAARAKSVFLANMSHDIRTPLTAILGFAEVLDLHGNGEIKEITAMIRSGGKRLMDTLNSVLDLARLEGGESPLKREPIDIRGELEELVDLFRSQANEKGIEFSYTYCREPVSGMVDRAAFTRVMMNLIGNALKFTAEGSVSVRLWEQSDRFYVAVEDTGLGIPKHVIPHIFDAFTRSRQSETRQIEGSGLGLTITRQLVRLMGGEIHVESEEGKGSSFTVSLMKSPKPLTSDPRQTEPQQAAEGSDARRSILAVEDNPSTQRLLGMLLKDQYDVALASTGAESLELAKQRPFDLVLMDLSLETSEAGIQYMQEMREIEPYQSVPILAFTAHALPGESERFQRLGFDGYLGKPFSIDVLRKTLADALANGRQEL